MRSFAPEVFLAIVDRMNRNMAESESNPAFTHFGRFRRQGVNIALATFVRIASRHSLRCEVEEQISPLDF